MYIRKLRMKLKANFDQEFARVEEDEILPLLRKQNGFREQFTLIAPDRTDVVAITFWDTKENAEAYNRALYPEILKILSKVIEGAPKIETFELLSSTFPKFAAKGA
jgi:hypothetical protein